MYIFFYQDKHLVLLFIFIILFEIDKKYDIQDFGIYNINAKKWTCFFQESSNIPYQRSLPCSYITKGKLYIYGGQKYKYLSNSLEIHDDEDISVFDFYKEKWYKFLKPSIEGRTSKMSLTTDWILTTSIYQSLIPGKRIYA